MFQSPNSSKWDSNFNIHHEYDLINIISKINHLFEKTNNKVEYYRTSIQIFENGILSPITQITE